MLCFLSCGCISSCMCASVSDIITAFYEKGNRRPLALEELLPTAAWVTERREGQAKSTKEDSPVSVIWRIMSPFLFLYSPVLFPCFPRNVSLYFYHFISIASLTLTILIHLPTFIDWIAQQEKRSKLNRKRLPGLISFPNESTFTDNNMNTHAGTHL